jgi:excisionase family DNA binding protein
MKTIFTTGQVARICKVAPRTVSKWFDSGRLRGYRIPGSQDRRIPRESLIRFLKEHNIPLPDDFMNDSTAVLCVSRNTARFAEITDEKLNVWHAESSFDAAGKFQQCHPRCAVIDFETLGEEAPRLAAQLSALSCVIIGVGNQTHAHESCAQFLQLPFDAALLCIDIKRHLGIKDDSDAP